ncbi:hypothetical protein Mucpa_2359 [Mucilaginibacter paludis DSM 18603]|uniref:Uncharacterized protein n=1 Tax=Mucilaginibacter paludis DSM 18603 TaxID=714943 RepID=H1YI54_9SPHI|nr:hypothetical protein Mucpa_2359 [Mucilaginibacter paludis DSM 18603]
MPPSLRNPTRLGDFILSTFMDEWHYLNSLRLHSGQIQQVPFDVILNDNPMDIADGVSRVETKFGMIFFDLFENLVIKHYNDDTVKLMFYTEIKNPNKPLNFFRQLQEELGGGWHYDPKFSTFQMIDKVTNLAKGKFESASDQVFHTWHHADFSFSLNFQIDPLRRLVFSVSHKVKKEIDRSVRAKGTLVPFIKNDLNKVLLNEALKEVPHLEDGKIKFTDYYYQLNEPEFGIFERAELKVFSNHKQIGPNTHSVVTYYSKYEVNTDKVLRLIDQLVDIYGTDDYGSRELELHEVEFIDKSESWTGRSWLVNQHHALQDLSNPSEYTVYQVRIGLDNIGNADDLGLNLSINGFNSLLEYDALMKAN